MSHNTTDRFRIIKADMVLADVTKGGVFAKRAQFDENARQWNHQSKAKPQSDGEKDDFGDVSLQDALFLGSLVAGCGFRELQVIDWRSEVTDTLFRWMLASAKA